MLGRWIFRLEEPVAKVTQASLGRFANETAEILSKLNEEAAGPAAAHLDRGQIARLLKEQPITYSNAVRDTHTNPKAAPVQSGYVLDSNGKPLHLVERRDVPASRVQFEMAAQDLHQQSPFTTYFPVTVERAPGVLVQERVGKSLFDRAGLLDRRFFSETIITKDERTFLQRVMGRPPAPVSRPAWFPHVLRIDESPSFAQASKMHSRFTDQLEQALTERSIWGDSDGHAGNFALRLRKGNLQVANLDIAMAFGKRQLPHDPLIDNFVGKPLSEKTLIKTDEFLTRFERTGGRQIMARHGFSAEQTDAMLARAQWFVRYQQFPNVGF